MSKPTPGPWRWDGETGTVWWGDRIVADVERDEDGPLIAAAPDLLEACQSIYNDMQGWRVSGFYPRGDWEGDIVQRLYDVIAKVEGHE